MSSNSYVTNQIYKNVALETEYNMFYIPKLAHDMYVIENYKKSISEMPYMYLV